MKSTLTLKGFENYLDKISAAGADIDAVADEALAAGAEVLRAGMERRAPEQTGKLKSHIKVKMVRGGNSHMAKVGIFDVDRVKETYFFYQEMGSARTNAHPYIRPAINEDAKKAKTEMRKIFKARGAI